MVTIIYIALGMVLLIGLDYLITYFDDIQIKWKQRLSRIRRLERRLFRNEKNRKKIEHRTPRFKLDLFS